MSPQLWPFCLRVSDLGMDHASDFSEPVDSESRPGSPGCGKSLHVFSDIALSGVAKSSGLILHDRRECLSSFHLIEVQRGMSQHLEGKDHILFIFTFPTSGKKPSM